MKAEKLASVLILVLGIAVLLVYFYTTGSSVEIKVIELCVKTCEGELAKGANLTDGPCLLNPMPTYPDWVCDVAHSPRVPADSMCGNMCSSYKEYNSFPFYCNTTSSTRTAGHFVEVNPDCSFARAV